MRETNARVAAAKATQQKAQAVLSSGFIDPATETSYAKLTSSAVDEVSKVTQKKALSLRTMERLMSSHTLAAGVAAGGLGIMYAFNRRRGEEQVGR
jgi:predicted component of type VI protein secretion system